MKSQINLHVEIPPNEILKPLSRAAPLTYVNSQAGPSLRGGEGTIPTFAYKPRPISQAHFS